MEDGGPVKLSRIQICVIRTLNLRHPRFLSYGNPIWDDKNEKCQEEIIGRI